MMILKVAWRNIWRHKVRSMVVILSIAIGLWAGVFMIAFSWGMYRQYMRSAISSQLSHLQLHNPDFMEDRDVKFTLDNTGAIGDYLGNIPDVKAYSMRTLATGMGSSPTAATGISIYGIDPASENNVTRLSERIIAGHYFDSTTRNPVLIGNKLAGRLKLKTRSKIILTFQDSAGEIVAGAFRVAGIYRSENTAMEEINVYTRSSDLCQLLGTGHIVNEIAVVLNDDNRVEPLKADLEKRFHGVDVRSWKDLAPDLELVIDSFNEFMYIFIGIILLALTFGILNTMLMAVLERVREIGMLMAIGMSKARIFFMIILETIFLSLIGGPLGLLTGYYTIRWTGKAGIDISLFGEGLASWGFSSMVYPELENNYYLPITIMTILTAILSAIYPAIRALRLNPSEAIRKI